MFCSNLDIYNNGTIYRVVEALFSDTHFFLVKTEKKQLVRELSKSAIFDDCPKNIFFRSGGLYKRGPLMVSYDQFWTLDLFPVLTKIICIVKSFNVLTTDFFKIHLRALVLIKFEKRDLRALVLLKFRKVASEP